MLLTANLQKLPPVCLLLLPAHLPKPHLKDNPVLRVSLLCIAGTGFSFFFFSSFPSHISSINKRFCLSLQALPCSDSPHSHRHPKQPCQFWSTAEVWSTKAVHPGLQSNAFQRDCAQNWFPLAGGQADRMDPLLSPTPTPRLFCCASNRAAKAYCPPSSHPWYSLLPY